MDTVNDLFLWKLMEMKICFPFRIHKILIKYSIITQLNPLNVPPPPPQETSRTDKRRIKTFFFKTFLSSCGYLLLDKLYHIFFIFLIILLHQLVGRTKALIPSPKYIFKKNIYRKTFLSLSLFSVPHLISSYFSFTFTVCHLKSI